MSVIQTQTLLVLGFPGASQFSSSMQITSMYSFLGTCEMALRNLGLTRAFQDGNVSSRSYVGLVQQGVVPFGPNILRRETVHLGSCNQTAAVLGVSSLPAIFMFY